MHFGIAFSSRIGKLIGGRNAVASENLTVAFQRKAAPLATERVGHFGRPFEVLCTQNAQFEFIDHLQCERSATLHCEVKKHEDPDL
jgi:hypothetical protein